MSKDHSSATILVVDDDRGIREFLCLLLKRTTKATVFEAADPAAGLRLARAGEGIQLLISDIDLRAEMDGVELASRVVGRSPFTKVILMSGCHSPRKGLRPDWHFLPKPFAITELAALIRLLLATEDAPVPEVCNVGSACRVGLRNAPGAP